MVYLIPLLIKCCGKKENNSNANPVEEGYESVDATAAEHGSGVVDNVVIQRTSMSNVSKSNDDIGGGMMPNNQEDQPLSPKTQRARLSSMSDRE